ncbi:hypothetical protein COCHEDRAFT_1026579 [Bipolaris maydis C5]|uniref:Uncharacterized protein n=1 Tax=Cochliobolus heterostrophus (strain C5 / ATCC 48332 / race O) TaxID=701091 RepID=M2V6U9_COCH5|nr:hypothetical protein COCHEDRAFT_1026579 [Bipolaris maydis C5]
MNALATGQFGHTAILWEVAEAESNSAGEVALRQSSWRENRLPSFATMCMSHAMREAQRHHVQAFQGLSQAALGYASSLAECLGDDAGAWRLCTIQMPNWLFGDRVRAAIIVPSPYVCSVHADAAIISLEKACFSSPHCNTASRTSSVPILILSKVEARDMHLPALTAFHQ